MAALAEGWCPRVRQLSLRSNELGPFGFAHVAACVQQGGMKRVEWLDVAVNGLGEEPGAVFLPILMSCELMPVLREVDMTFNGLEVERARGQVKGLQAGREGRKEGGVLVRLERKSTVPIIRRTQSAPAAIVVHQPQQQQQQPHAAFGAMVAAAGNNQEQP